MIRLQTAALALVAAMAAPAAAQDGDAIRIDYDEVPRLSAPALARKLLPEYADAIVAARAQPADTGYEIVFSERPRSSGYAGLCTVDLHVVYVGAGADDPEDAPLRRFSVSDMTGYRLLEPFDATPLAATARSQYDVRCAQGEPPLDDRTPGYFTIDSRSNPDAAAMVATLVRARADAGAASRATPIACIDRSVTPSSVTCADPLVHAERAPLAMLWGIGIDQCEDADAGACLVSAYYQPDGRGGHGDRLWVRYAFEGGDPLARGARVSAISVARSTLER